MHVDANRGVRQVELGSDACFIGHRAYENCKQLTLVDISGAAIHILHMHTFSQCHSLETVKLSSCLREIRAEVFIGCKALAHELSHLVYSRNRVEAWRYPYAAFNAFEEHYIPPRESDWIAPPS